MTQWLETAMYSGLTVVDSGRRRRQNHDVQLQGKRNEWTYTEVIFDVPDVVGSPEEFFQEVVGVLDALWCWYHVERNW